MSRYKRGGDIVSSASKFADKIGIPLKNWHLPNHKFTGPFTDLESRIYKDGNPLPGYEPYNQIDNIALHHDVCYKSADELGNKTRHQCDKEMLNELNTVKTKGLREKLDYLLVKSVIWVKHKLGLGITDNIQLAKELHRPITRKFKRRRVYASNINKIWSADLMDKSNLSTHNKGYKYLLNVIDLFSKYAYSIPLKSKPQHEVAAAFTKLFLKNKPDKLWTDQGSEFINKSFKKFLNEHNIEIYHVHNEGKACVIERFNRTLGNIIQQHLTSTSSNNYVNKLQQFINEYNNKNHATIKMTPLQGTDPAHSNLVLYNTHKNDKVNIYEPKFKVGDRVRIYSYKTKFDKGTKANWTREIFVMSDVRHTNPITYKLTDLNGEDIIGSFYSQELQFTKF